MNDIEVIEARIATARLGLIEVQLKQHQDSKILTFSEVLDRWCSGPIKNEAAFSLAFANQYPVKVFYECGLKPDGTYRHRGCRYGSAPHQYLSGFGSYGV